MSIQSFSIFAEGIAPFADLLVWNISQETSSTWASVTSSAGTHKVDIKAPNVDFNWNLGFRGGVFYEANSKFWDTKFAWTYFKATTNSNIALASQLLFPEFFSGFISDNFFFGGKLDWRFIMNMFDIEFGHKLMIGKSLTIRPSMGIKGGTIYQTVNCDWDALLYTSTEKVKHNFVGLGPSFGIDTEWHIFKELSLFGDFGTAILWGNWQIKDTYTRPFVPLIVSATTITTSMNSSMLGTLMFDYCLGLKWSSTTQPRISIQIGYEMQLWTNQLRIPTFQQLPVHGDLTLQGGTCRIVIDF